MGHRPTSERAAPQLPSSALANAADPTWLETLSRAATAVTMTSPLSHQSSELSVMPLPRAGRNGQRVIPLLANRSPGN
jgi:hypothetical protein